MSTTKKQLKKIEQDLCIEEPKRYFSLICVEKNGEKRCHQNGDDKIYENEEDFKKEQKITEKDILMVINYKAPEGV